MQQINVLANEVIPDLMNGYVPCCLQKATHPHGHSSKRLLAHHIDGPSKRKDIWLAWPV
jgi:hypothetical protein